MKITEIYEAQGNTVFSIEFMPPRNGSDINKIYNDIKMLNYDVSFITITMGSNKSLRGGTAALASMIKKKFGKEPVVHLTCVNRSKYEMENILTAFKYLEITNIMALRGDAPEGEGGFQKHPEGHQYANELVEQINAMNQGKYFLRNTDKEMGLVAEDAKYREAEKTNFCICVAGYPEKHIEADNFDEDIKNLKRKVDAGADIITIHPEATENLEASILKIKELNKIVGVSLNPESKIDLIEKFLDKIDLVLIMSVNPGFGGQKFMPEVLEKIKELKKIQEKKNINFDIEIDGGINFDNFKIAIEAGANILVSGTTIFKSNDGDIKKNINLLKLK